MVEQQDNVPTHSPQKFTDHLRIASHLVDQLRAVLEISDDGEVHRLLKEIEHELMVLSVLPSPPCKENSSPREIKTTKKKLRGVDIDLALQPLRSENCDLRRKLRLANQKMKDLQEQIDKTNKFTQDAARDEGILEKLHRELFLEKENVIAVKRQKEHAEKLILQTQNENSNLEEEITNKDDEIASLQNELRNLRSKISSEADVLAKQQLNSLEMTVQTKNKQMALLNLAIKQRDGEIERLTVLTRGLQQSLTRVLSNVQDLRPDDILSDVSMLSAFDSWKPSGRNHLAPSNVPQSTSTYPFIPPSKNVAQPDVNFNIQDLGLACNREYTSPSRVYRRMSVDSIANDEADTIMSVSSTDEATFKQDLANLDSMITRLQNSLKRK
ncbi:coiled-coil domain-containing protein 14-like [Xenia sp. Carnegie-2017]|uniref:coiled-coil domain-containing protein 14-like n=1 Tax=Xenia sp. Carnegie-2017 TaxID=2897299 RepID=UPI001F045E2B|nr:coiled-coil domain-containing protein 14-like [Xenia sp. Carnegie-2017]XP_046860293.1 coiled-coil domain-containing protein 14-like [Xenia sp. Carnegie-2017]